MPVVVYFLKSLLSAERCHEHLGCWRDAKDRAIEEPVVIFRDDLMEQCLDLAAEKGYTVFGLEVGEECWTAADAMETYQKHGRATDGYYTCKNREGGPWSLDVYKIIPCTGITICLLKKRAFP